jgi:hypothetical protein
MQQEMCEGREGSSLNTKPLQMPRIQLCSHAYWPCPNLTRGDLYDKDVSLNKGDMMWVIALKPQNKRRIQGKLQLIYPILWWAIHSFQSFSFWQELLMHRFLFTDLVLMENWELGSTVYTSKKVDTLWVTLMSVWPPSFWLCSWVLLELTQCYLQTVILFFAISNSCL